MGRFISLHRLACVVVILILHLIVVYSSSSSLYTNISSDVARGLCSPEESSALLQFKRTFTINRDVSWRCDANFHCDPYKGCHNITTARSIPKTKYWKAGSDCCSWNGVTCDEISGHVIKLDLGCSQLQGTVHPNSSLFQLSHMQSLNLAFNNFTASQISSEFGQFVDLTYLNLSSSILLGVIPLEISKLAKLTHLDLSFNELSGQISSTVLSSLEQLEFLDLSVNKLEGQILNSLANLTKLTHLDLSDNEFSGQISSTVFSNLEQLEFLDLSWNQLEGRIPNSFVNLTRLIHLDLSENEFSSQVSSTVFSSLEQLEFLDLSRNQFEGRILNSLANLTKLTHLDLSLNKLSGQVSSTVFSNLEFLDLSYNSFEGQVLNSFANLSQINLLRVSDNHFTGHIPANTSGFQLISELDLSFNSFNGPIPSWLFTRPSLTNLYLRNNQLTGEIPIHIGNLLNLSQFDLSSNLIGGMLPPALFSLPSLETLYLFNNLLSGPIPSNVTGLQKLDYLDLSDNMLNSTIPSALLVLPSLTSLGLSNNKLIGHVGEVQSNSLRDIDLSNNYLQGANFSSVSNLIGLNLASNNLTGTLELDAVLGFSMELLDLSFNTNLSLDSNNKVDSPFPHLLYLKMSSCNLSAFPYFLGNFVGLKELDLSNNKIHGSLPEWLGSMGKESLVSFNLSHNFLTSSVEILPWSNLEILDLSFNLLQGALPIPPSTIITYNISSNKLSREIHPRICNLSVIELVDFSKNSLSGNIPNCLFNIKTLSALKLHWNNLSGTIPETVRCSLTRLYLSHNRLQGQIPRSLANCTILKILDLGYNFISDTFPSWLETMTELKILILGTNRFYGYIEKPRNASAFAKLSIIDLSYNKFSGNLPSYYFHVWKSMMMTSDDNSLMKPTNYSDRVTLTNKDHLMELDHILALFKLVDFSNNNFKGKIPESIGDLKSLIVLNLSSNDLTGEIPASLGNLNQLQSLDLSNNKLSGKIPAQLNSLTFLGAFNVSQNNLEGPIPQTGQLSTFPYDSYKANPGLCGIPLPKKCEEIQVSPSPILSYDEQEKDLDMLFDGFNWKSVAIGYGCGAIIRIVIGNIIIARNEEWVLSIFNIRLLWRIKRSNNA